MELLLATRNESKVSEIRDLLSELPLEVLSLQDIGFNRILEETGTTLEENALLKARAVFQELGRPVLADDSGLEVQALEGAPGVYSSRFAGPEATDEENNQQLLERMKGLPREERRAQFRTVLALILPGEEPYLLEGRCEGYIACSASGDYGFGYDPLFVIPEYEQTFAQLGPEIKNNISHRARALEKLKDLLKSEII